MIIPVKTALQKLQVKWLASESNKSHERMRQTSLVWGFEVVFTFEVLSGACISSVQPPLGGSFWFMHRKFCNTVCGALRSARSAKTSLLHPQQAQTLSMRRQRRTKTARKTGPACNRMCGRRTWQKGPKSQLVAREMVIARIRP